MTRLQRRSSSCDCGKTTKESRPFVTKNKIYETRSGVQRRQETIFDDCQKELALNTLNLRGKVYLKKMETSIVTLPLRNDNLNGDTRIKLIKNSNKICNKRYNKVVGNGTTQTLLKSPFEKIITAKIKMDILDISDIRSKEDNAISNDLSPKKPKKELVKSLDETNDENKGFQNGDFIQTNNCGNGNEVLTNGKFHLSDIKKEDIVSLNCNASNGDSETLNCSVEESALNNCEIDDFEDENLLEGEKQKGRRKTNIELFIKETCDNLGLGTVTDKRTRKAPSSYSPVLKKKFQLEEECSEAKSKPNLTLSGVPKKKSGRKRKPKGPILHYLDLYIKNKEKVSECSTNFQSSQCESSNNYQQSTQTENQDTNKTEQIVSKIPCTNQQLDESVELLSTECYEDIKVEVVNDCRKVSLSINAPEYLQENKLIISNDYSIKTEEKILVKRRKKGRKPLPIKKKKVEKLEALEYDSSVTHVLGYRISKGIKEILVLFENGTSNWIPSTDRHLDINNLQKFYEHCDQDLSIINRLGYQIVFANSDEDGDDSCTVTADSDSSFLEDNNLVSDSDEVFFTTFPSRLSTRSIDPTYPPPEVSFPAIPRDCCTRLGNEMLSEADLNDLCNYVMSSRHVKLYPFEMAQEVISKADDEFVHIYLKRLLKKDHTRAKCIESLNLKSCERLINILEECAVNSQCKVVVISGVEEYFAMNNIFEKLLKKSAALEGKKYEQDISMLRYLIQTIRNFNKPIVGVIKKTANGLSASLLSLFDMVFHERNGECVKAKYHSPTKSSRKGRKVGANQKQILSSPADTTTYDSDSSCVNDACQTFVFPRLMGLAESNEAKIMGERQRPTGDSPNDITSNVPCFSGALSQQLRCSVRHMKNNCKIQIKNRGRSQSEVSEEHDTNNVDHYIAKQESVVDNREDLTSLEKQIQREKELTEKYMADLLSYMNSIDKHKQSS